VSENSKVNEKFNTAKRGKISHHQREQKKKYKNQLLSNQNAEFRISASRKNK